MENMMIWWRVGGSLINALNCIHYMHDKYSYERIQMAVQDTYIHRTTATGIFDFSVAADSLSACKYGKDSRQSRDENGVVVDFEVERRLP